MGQAEHKLEKMMQSVKNGNKEKDELKDVDLPFETRFDDVHFDFESINIGFRLRVYVDDDSDEFYNLETLEEYEPELAELLSRVGRNVFGEESEFEKVSGLNLQIFTDTYRAEL